jgi:hypothetical protein
MGRTTHNFCQLNGRLLTSEEIEAWAAYESLLKKIPNGKNYDRVSIHRAFPKVNEAFNHACHVSEQVRRMLMIKEKFEKLQR